MRDDAALRQDEPPVRLVHDVHRGGQVERREASRNLGSVEHLVLDVVRIAGADDALEDLGAALDDPGRVQQLVASLVLEPVGVLEVPESDDAGEPV